ncbi:MAG: MBL fold metallo-hydrolase [Candidatus Hermodarchaeota archaeon]|nr:MBL fold metallo-hydrolase [Candidatus Hermodarchaeota archaeon]
MQSDLSDFQLIESPNIVVKAGKQRLVFDPNKTLSNLHSKNNITCISHAHSDHTAGFQSALRKIVTPATLDIYRTIRKKPHNVQPIVPGASISLEDTGSLSIQLAGHMLGAAQFILERNGKRLVFTGDFNLSSSLTTEGATPIPCDVLLMEATYGRPDAVFPPREQVYSEIAEWVSQKLKTKQIPLFQVYAAGKAQEVIRILNTFLTIPVVVDSTIAKIAQVYQNHGIPLGYLADNTPEGQEVLTHGECAYLTSKRNQQPRTLRGRKFARAVTTGWAKLFPMKNVDKSFVLSAHADFQQLVDYVKIAKPRSVFVTTGNRVTFGAVLEKLNIKQLVPQRRPQMELVDFI